MTQLEIPRTFQRGERVLVDGKLATVVRINNQRGVVIVEVDGVKHSKGGTKGYPLAAVRRPPPPPPVVVKPPPAAKRAAPASTTVGPSVKVQTWAPPSWRGRLAVIARELARAEGHRHPPKEGAVVRLLLGDALDRAERELAAYVATLKGR